jgi:hypothetical protein
LGGLTTSIRGYGAQPLVDHDKVVFAAHIKAGFDSDIWMAKTER